MIYIGAGLATSMMGMLVSEPYTAPTNFYVGFNTSVGGTDEATYLSTEVDGYAYTRKEVNLSLVGSELRSTNSVTWSNLPATTIYSLFVSDSSISGSGSVLYATDLDAPFDVASGSGIMFATDTLVIAFTSAQLIG